MRTDTKLLVAHELGIALITFNRPARRDAFNGRGCRQFARALEHAASAPEILGEIKTLQLARYEDLLFAQQWSYNTGLQSVPSGEPGSWRPSVAVHEMSTVWWLQTPAVSSPLPWMAPSASEGMLLCPCSFSDGTR
jgi:hypothetical protein